MQARERQRFLKSHGFDCGKIDGEFGPWSQRADIAYSGMMERFETTRSVQNMHNIPANGICGPETRACDPLLAARNPRERIIHMALSLVGKNPRSRCKWECSSPGFVTHCGRMAFDPDPSPYPERPVDSLRSPTWQQGLKGATPRPADVFGVYMAASNRVGRFGLIYEWPPSSPYCLTIEETAPVDSSSRVVMKRRMKSDIFSVKDWIGGK